MTHKGTRVMLYPTAKAWREAPQKRILLFGMSGLGKTRLSNILRGSGEWFHYSVDYRIGTRYMGEHIADNFKAEAMKNPFLAQLLRSDSIYVASNITFDNLAPLSTYLGKPGDPSKGGVPFAEYMRRQALHAEAERAAMLDTSHFIERAKLLYGYDNFVCDSSGSIVEVVDPEDPGDPVLTEMGRTLLPVWIEGSDVHTKDLIRRFDRDPKPMYYQPAFLDTAWSEYRRECGGAEEAVDPDAFVRWAFARALAHRAPRYAAIARNWGVTVTGEEAANVHDANDMIDLVGQAIDRRP